MDKEIQTDSQQEMEKPIFKSKNTSKRKIFQLSSVLKWIKKTKIINKHTCKAIIAIIVIFWLANPILIPFLPQYVKIAMVQATTSIWGNIEAVPSVLPISWVIFFQLIVMILFLYLVSEFVRAFLENRQFLNKRWQTFSTVFLSTMDYTFAIIGIIWALRIMGIDTTVIFAGIGIVSLIIGFSADSLIADMVTGVFLLFDNQFNVGDIIDVEEFHGEVIKIGFRSTALKDQGGNIKIINNSSMCNIINRSNERSMAFCDITVPTKLDVYTIEDNMQIVVKKLKEKEAIFLETPEYLGIQSLDGDQMVLRMVAWVDERNIYHAQRLINRAVKIQLQNLMFGDKLKDEDT